MKKSAAARKMAHARAYGSQRIMRKTRFY